MYGVNMNRRMEKYSNRRNMCTQMEEFVIVKQLEGKKSSFFPFSFYC